MSRFSISFLLFWLFLFFLFLLFAVFLRLLFFIYLNDDLFRPNWVLFNYWICFFIHVQRNWKLSILWHHRRCSLVCFIEHYIGFFIFTFDTWSCHDLCSFFQLHSANLTESRVWTWFCSSQQFCSLGSLSRYESPGLIFLKHSVITSCTSSTHFFFINTFSFSDNEIIYFCSILFCRTVETSSLRRGCWSLLLLESSWISCTSHRFHARSLRTDICLGVLKAHVVKLVNKWLWSSEFLFKLCHNCLVYKHVSDLGCWNEFKCWSWRIVSAFVQVFRHFSLELFFFF